MIYGRATENSTDGKDATRTLGTRFDSCGSPANTHDHPQCSGNTPGHARTTQGSPRHVKDAPDAPDATLADEV